MACNNAKCVTRNRDGYCATMASTFNSCRHERNLLKVFCFRFSDIGWVNHASIRVRRGMKKYVIKKTSTVHEVLCGVKSKYARVFPWPCGSWTLNGCSEKSCRRLRVVNKPGQPSFIFWARIFAPSHHHGHRLVRHRVAHRVTPVLNVHTANRTDGTCKCCNVVLHEAKW